MEKGYRAPTWEEILKGDGIEMLCETKWLAAEVRVKDAKNVVVWCSPGRGTLSRDVSKEGSNYGMFLRVKAC